MGKRIAAIVLLCVLVVMIVLPLCAITAEGDNKPGYLIQYSKGYGGRPNWYYHKNTGQCYIRVKSKGRWIYCPVWNANGTKKIWKGNKQ